MMDQQMGERLLAMLDLNQARATLAFVGIKRKALVSD
jgi:hypothetical protein